MTQDEVLSLGFTTDRLPSGRYNLCHKDRFIMNEFITIVRKDGQWIRTFETTNYNELFDKIKSIDFMETK